MSSEMQAPEKAGFTFPTTNDTSNILLADASIEVKRSQPQLSKNDRNPQLGLDIKTCNYADPNLCISELSNSPPARPVDEREDWADAEFTSSSNGVARSLADLAREEAVKGESSVLIVTGSEYARGTEKPMSKSKPMQIEIDYIERNGFKAEIRLLNTESPDTAQVKYELRASWDADHHPEIAQITADSKKEKVDIIAAERKGLDRCDNIFALDAATALDANRLPDASKLLEDCGIESTGLFVDLPKFQHFAESVANQETKGTGFDLSLKYGVGRGTAFYLDGIEIK